jgi:hypothetical protein
MNPTDSPYFHKDLEYPAHNPTMTDFLYIINILQIPHRGHSLHCKYIGRRYYDILSCLIYHRNFVVFFTVDGWVQPLVAAVFDYRHRQQVVLCINCGICFF